MVFATDLQTSHAALVTLQDGELRLLENMRRCMSLRIKCDREYAVALNGVHTQAQKLESTDDLKSSTVHKSWNSIIEDTESLSQLMKQNADFLATHTLESLTNLIAEKRALRKHYAEEHTRIHGELSKLQESVIRSKQDYEKYLESWKMCKTKYEDLYMKAGKTNKKLEEAKDKYLKITKKLHRIHNDYVLLLCEASEYEDKLRTVLIPDLLNYQQTVLEESVENWKNILRDYTHYTDLSCESFQVIHERMRKAVELISAENEYDPFTTKHKSSQIQPMKFAFDNHLLQEYTGNLKPNEISVDDCTLDTLKVRMQDVWTRLSQAESDLHSREAQMMQYELEISSMKKTPENMLSISVKKRAVDILRKQIGELRCQEQIFKCLRQLLDAPLNTVGPDGPPPALLLEEAPSIDNTSKVEDDTISIAASAVGKSAKMVIDRFWSTIHSKRGVSTSASATSSPALVPKHSKNLKVRMPEPTVGVNSDMVTTDGYSLMSPSQTRSLQDEDWFHGVLPREEVVRLLAKDGDYLVRQTTRNEENQLVLSACWQGHKHFIVQTTPDGKFCFEGPSFTTIQELIMYQHNCGQPVTLRSGAVLKNPILRERWELNNDDVELRDKIGRGNFGDVYSAVLKPSGMEVAVKTCRMNLPDEQKKKFLQEGRILKQYDHPNIVKFIGICVQKQPIMIVMELVPGGSLLAFLRNKGQQMNVLDLLTLCCDAASGMEYLESKGCIHRDLAARNCLVSKQNEVKISDFGMSREEEEYIVSDGMKQIPIKWTAPEALNFGKYNSMCDVWSYGVLMWEVFSLGSTPYCGLSNNRTRELIDSGYRLPSPENTPEPVYELMLRCWEYDPERRIHFNEINTVLQAIAQDFR